MNPTAQNRYWSRVAWSSSVTAPVNAASNADSAAPGERESDRVGAAASHRAECVHEDRCDRRADEREPHQAEHIGDLERPDGEHHGECGAGVDAEESGVGQGVAGDPLHERAGDAECGTDHHREDGARQPQVADDEVVGDGRVEVRERLDDGAERDRLRADRERQDDAEPDPDEEHQDAGGSPCSRHVGDSTARQLGAVRFLVQRHTRPAPGPRESGTWGPTSGSMIEQMY